MNAIAQMNIQTMSSREIAGLTSKRHADVLRDCRVMFSELGLDAKGYEQNCAHPQNGQTYTEFMLTKDLVETLITGYSIKLRHAVIQRLHELEQQVAQPVFDISNPVHLLQAIEVQAKQNIELIHKVEVLEPKAKALDILSQNRSGYLCLTDAAKHLHIGRQELINILINRKLIYRRATSNLTKKGKLAAYDRAIQNCWMFHDYKAGEKPNGAEFEPQVLVTPKGMAHVAQLINQTMGVLV